MQANQIAIPAARGDRRRVRLGGGAGALARSRYLPGRGRLRAAPAGASSRRPACRPRALPALREAARQGTGQLPLRRRSRRPLASTSSGSRASCARSSSAPATTAASGATGSRPRTATRSTSAAPTRSRFAPAAGGPRGTLHYVNVSGTTSAAVGLLNGARRGDQLRLHLAPPRSSSRRRPTRRRPSPTIVTRGRLGRESRRAAAARPARPRRTGR